jgi:RNA polymerase sigma-70 factor, ECF subfamily
MFNDVTLIKESANLRKFALRLTRNSSDAEDLLQSTLVRAIEKKELFQTDTSLFKWTSKIMYNLFVTEYRRKTRYETKYDPEALINAQTTEANQENVVDLKRVGEAMGHLSPEHREILVLVCIKNMRYEEAAEALKVPVGTVRSRLSRAREGLQKLLEAPNALQDDIAYASGFRNLPRLAQQQRIAA